jgi:hypothetical protein
VVNARRQLAGKPSIDATWWNESQQTYLRSTLSEAPPHVREAHAIHAALGDLLARAESLLKAHPELDSNQADTLRRLIDADPWGCAMGAKRAALGRHCAWTARRLIVVNHGYRDAWWWKGEPRNRDLAMLSLLAGNMPDGPRKVLSAYRREGGSVLGLPTVLDVVRAEERTIAHVRASLRRPG